MASIGEDFARAVAAKDHDRVRRDDGPHLVEQQAYLTERDGQIGWLRIMCSGYRPVEARDA